VRFVCHDGHIVHANVMPDESGHGSRIARVITDDRNDLSVAYAQVLDAAGRTSADCVAAGIDWCLEQSVDLIHLSLGLVRDRRVLRTSIERAVGAGCVIVASVPARGAVPYPAAYPGVLRATGDARCPRGHISRLSATTFGGCPKGPGDRGGGASMGAAHVTRMLIGSTLPCDVTEAIAVLSRRADWTGSERRGEDPLQS
jgi:hypothetical protein